MLTGLVILLTSHFITAGTVIHNQNFDAGLSRSNEHWGLYRTLHQYDTSFLQPASLTEGTNTLTYTYGADENRVKGILTQGGSTTNTRYYFGDYEKDITGASTKHIHYISAGDGLMAIVIREAGTDTYYYTYTDHLGSILSVTNSAGTVIHNQNFDACLSRSNEYEHREGRYRNTSNWTYTSITAPPAWLTRGYTGHEHLPLFGIINMNGRLYDPVVGRMLAVDNNIQAAGLTQNYNRYTYALNNPLRYTDPDGEFLFLIPHISFGGKSGLSIGLEVGVGVPGILSASITGGYNFNSKNGYWSVQGSALGGYVGYGSNGAFAGIGYHYAGFSVGYEFLSNTVNIGLGGSFGNGYAGSIGISLGRNGLDYNVGLSSTYMWGTVSPGFSAEPGNENNEKSVTGGRQVVGSVGMYENETLAYNVMFEQSQNKGVETSAWITDNGILMMPIEYPTYKNTATSSDNNYYKVTLSGKKYFVHYNVSRYKINGQIHTHPNANTGLSIPDFALANSFNLNVFTIGTKNIHVGSNGNQSFFGLTKNILNGKLTIIKK